MVQTLYIGDFTHTPSSAEIKQITQKADLETVKTGDFIQKWDYIMQTSKETFLSPAELEPLRHQSDQLADDLVEYLNPKAGQDLFALLTIALAQQKVDERVTNFWKHITQEPPSNITGLIGNSKFTSQAEFTPIEAIQKLDRLANPSLATGQAVFSRFSAPIIVAVLCFSLAGGFTSPKLLSVMKETSYLTSTTRDATFRRLLETSLFVIDAMGDMSIGGVGWKSTVRLRLLHAMVRKRIRMGKGKFNDYNEATEGVPINRADLCAVLGSFMITPIWAMQRTGIYLNDHEKLAYQAAWRHVGYYLGIEEELLFKFYGSSWSTAEGSLLNMIFNLFPEEQATDFLKTPTYQMLESVSLRKAPLNHPVAYLAQYSRRLLGDKLSDQLAIPNSIFQRVLVEKEIWSMWYAIEFGKYWRRKWETERQYLFAKRVEISISTQLGNRTKFSWREESKQATEMMECEGEPFSPISQKKKLL